MHGFCCSCSSTVLLLRSVSKGGNSGTQTHTLLEMLQDDLTGESSKTPFSDNEDGTSCGKSVDGMHEGEWGFGYALVEGIKGVTFGAMK